MTAAAPHPARFRRRSGLTRTLLAVGMTVATFIMLAAPQTIGVTGALFTGNSTAAVQGMILTNYARAVLSDSPRQYMPMWETTGRDAWDVTTNGPWWYTLTDDGSGTVSLAGSPLHTGTSGSMALSGGYAQLSGPSNFYPKVAGDTITVEFWMYVPSAQTAGAAVWTMSNGGLIWDGTRFGFTTYNIDCWCMQRTSLVDRPVHVAAVFKQASTVAGYQTGQKLYIDGVLQTLTQDGTPSLAAMQDFWDTSRIGMWNNAWRLTGARVSDVALYSGELSATRISAHYAARNS